MGIALYYQTIYLIIVTIFSFFYFHKYSFAGNYTVKERTTPAVFLAIFLILFIGMRPVHAVFSDTVGYASHYNLLQGNPFSFEWDTQNILFDNLLAWMSSERFSVNTWFVVIAAIYFGCRLWSCKKMFPHNTSAAFLLFLAAFISFTSSVNGFKAGVAASLFCVAIAYKGDKRWWIPIIFLALSYGFHHSMHVCIAAYLVCMLYNNTKVYYVFWIFALICAISHIDYFQNFFANLTDEKGAGYLLSDVDEGWHTGMRYDFVIYSVMPMILGWYIKFKQKLNIKGYDFILNLYILLNSIWLLCMYASFTNRIASLSWFMYSIVLAYPFLRGEQIFRFNKNMTFATIMILHLAFTLFMHFVYYV